MHRFAHISMTAALAAAILAPHPPASAQQLGYSLPSPATATYHLVDTLTVSIVSIMGATDFGGHQALTYALTFGSGEAGVQVSGELTDFSAVENDPMAGTSEISQEQAGLQDFALTLGPTGVVEISTSSIAPDSDLPMLADPHSVFFPNLPDGELAAGGTWTDSVAITLGDQGSKVVAYTYTVAGEETVDGRTYLRVDISGDGTMEMGDGMMGDLTLTGGESGYFLWDTERSLMAVLELARNFTGSIPGPGGTSMTMTFATTTRAALEN